MPDFSINGLPTQGVDPNAYAQKYADEHGITLEEAKAELKAKYGDPQQPEMSMQEGLLKFSGDDANFDINPYQAVTQDPAKLEKFILEGAKKAGCTPEEFAEMLGIEPNAENNASERLTKKDKKEWIKQYQAEHNCTKKEAKEAFDKEFKYDVMPHKEAKEWIKNYMEQTGCSKKEARTAFKEEFGYNVPDSTLSEIAKFLLKGLVAAPAAFAGGVLGGPIGFAAVGGLAAADMANSNKETGAIYAKREQ